MLVICRLVYLLLVLRNYSQNGCVLASQFEALDNGYFRNLPCPNPDDIEPCICTYLEDINAMDMNCTTIADEQQLFDVFHAVIPIPKFRKLTLGTNNLATLSNTVFGDATFEDVRTINHTSGTLTSVGPNTFMKSASTLSLLYLHHNQLSDFPFETLSKYMSLGSFSLWDNPLSHFPIIQSETLGFLSLGYDAYQTIPADALEGLPNLNRIHLPGNNVHSMATDIFTSLPKMRTIIMYSAGLTHLEGNQFAVGSTIIEKIDLNGNEIASLDAGAFTGVRSGTIYMKNNKLTVFPEVTWGPVIEAGVVVRLEGNDLTCGCDVAWLVLEPLYHEQVKDAVCHSGELLVDLDPHIYELC